MYFAYVVSLRLVDRIGPNSNYCTEYLSRDGRCICSDRSDSSSMCTSIVYIYTYSIYMCVHHIFSHFACYLGSVYFFLEL